MLAEVDFAVDKSVTIDGDKMSILVMKAGLQSK